MSEANLWSRFDHDPRVGANATLRASDRDRDLVNAVLVQAYSEGRLTPAEFDERTDQVTRSRTLGELPPLVSDLVPVVAPPSLPGRFRAEAERRHRERVNQALWAFLVPTVICWTVWLSVLLAGHGTGFPWPVFVTLGTGAGWVRLITTRDDHVRGIEEHLERRERRRIERGRRRLPPPQA